MVRFRDNFAGNTLLELDEAAGYVWYGIKKAYAWVTGGSTELLYPTGILSGKSVRPNERSRIVGEAALTAIFGGSNRLLSAGRVASVDDLIGMMNQRAGTTARYATGDSKQMLNALDAAGSHFLLEDGTSDILIRRDVASRWTAFHEWLHRRLQRGTGGSSPGEDDYIEGFLERHRDFLRLDE